MKRDAVVLGCVTAVVFGAQTLMAALIAGHIHQWETGGDEETWALTDPGGYSDVYTQNTVGGQGSLEVQGDTGGDFGPIQTMTISTVSGNGPLAPNQDYQTKAPLLQPVETIYFDFYANADSGASGATDSPGQLVLFVTGGGVTWYYDITSFTSEDWQTYAIAVGDSYSGPWYMPGGGESEGNWDTAWTDVDEIGFLLQLTINADDQQFAFDNFYLDDSVPPVPEPGTYAMLAASLIGMGVTFRRKVGDSLKGLLKS